MIKIRYTERKQTERKHYLYVKERIRKNWNIMKMSAYAGDTDALEKVDVLENLQKTLKISPAQLNIIIQKIAISRNLRELIKIQKRWFRLAGADKEALSQSVAELLDYDKFAKGLTIKLLDKTMLWNRHCLMMASNTRVCPYCGRQYITTWAENTTASCDHYYPKSSYPLLSINMYNLIPCCHICNSVMKGNPKSSKDEFHLNPYIDSSDCLKFQVKTETTGSIFNFSEKVIEIDVVRGNIKSEAQKSRADKSCETFRLKEIYQYHKREAFELRRALREEENEKYQDIFKENFKGLSAVQNYAFLYREREVTEEPLVKFKKDIEKQFKE